jgi:hypothetical protein
MGGVTFDYQLEALRLRARRAREDAENLAGDAEEASLEVQRLEAAVAQAEWDMGELGAEAVLAEQCAVAEEAALKEYEHLNEAYDELFPGAA